MSCCAMIVCTGREAHNGCHAPARFPLPITAVSVSTRPRGRSGSCGTNVKNVKGMLTDNGLHPPNSIAQVRWPAQL
jgi:hypothetical protein